MKKFSNILKINRCNINYHQSTPKSTMVERRCRRRIKLLSSFFCFSLLLVTVSISSVEGFFSPRKSELVVRKLTRFEDFRRRSFLSSSLYGKVNTALLVKKNFDENERQVKSEIFSLWEEKERLYQGLEENANNVCDHCDNRESCKSIIQKYETNQMLSSWNKVAEKDNVKLVVGEQERNLKGIKKNEMIEVQSLVKSIWLPLLKLNHLKPGDLIPIDLDLQELGIIMIDENDDDKNKEASSSMVKHKKHLLLAVGDSISEEYLSIIDNVSPLLMLPVNVYDMANQYRNMLKSDEEEIPRTKVNVACGMKQGKGSFRLRKNHDKSLDERTEEGVQSRQQKYGKKERHQLSSTDSQIKSIMYNGKDYYYYEDTDEIYDKDSTIYNESGGIDYDSLDQEYINEITQGNEIKNNTPKTATDEYVDEDATNSMLPFFPSLNIGPMINRCTSVKDFNERIQNGKKNSFLTSVQMYKLRINEQNILEIYLGKGKYTI